jgi:hypothetical protein
VLAGGSRVLAGGSRVLAACGLVAVSGLLSACAPASGWSRTDARTCQPEDPALVCSRAEPDHGHTLAVADATLIPGECALAPAERGPARVRVETRDPRGQGQRRRIRAPRGKVTIVAIEADGQVDVVERVPCDRQPIPID